MRSTFHAVVSPVAVSSVALSLILAVSTPSARAQTIATVGVYDEQTVETNTSDFTATGSAFSLTDYRTRMVQAFSQDAGGVYQVDAVSNSGGFFLSYGAERSKSVFWGAGANTTIGGTGTFPNLFTAVSGGAILQNVNTGNTTFVLGAITGGQVGEQVNTFAITVLSQGTTDTAIGPPGLVTVTATYSDATTTTLSRTINEAAGAGDTFFSFVAPTGFAISNVTFSPANNFRMSFDDLAFTTTAFVAPGGVVPEPSAALATDIFGAMLATLLAARRGKK